MFATQESPPGANRGAKTAFHRATSSLADPAGPNLGADAAALDLPRDQVGRRLDALARRESRLDLLARCDVAVALDAIEVEAISPNTLREWLDNVINQAVDSHERAGLLRLAGVTA